MAVVPSWVESHCVVPGGFHKGEPFRLYNWQLAYYANFYLVRGDVEYDARNPILAPAFVNRRALIVGPQKLGKNPVICSNICVEGVGPSLFADWAGKDDGYACSEHGCPCGWEYPYESGEPMGMVRPTSLIQITAVSEDSTDNTYGWLIPMIEDGPLADVIPHTGEQFIRLPGRGRIDRVTSSARSRLGNPVTFAPQDEGGLWTPQNDMDTLADAQYRGLSGMSGRSVMTTNPWDIAEHSVAQVQFESKATDIYRYFVRPPANLSFRDKRERRKIFGLVYPKDTLRQNGGHVDLDSIEAEAVDIAARDLAQACRFYGNQLMAGAGHAFDLKVWAQRARPGYFVKAGSIIVIGFDGSYSSDASGFVGTEVATGFQWPLALWERKPSDPPDWEVPRDEAVAVLEQVFEIFRVFRLYADPAHWETQLGEWAGRWGAERVIGTWTNKWTWMARAVRAFEDAIAGGQLTHSGDPDYARHIANAVKQYVQIRDEKGHPMHVITKERPDSPDKIDLDVAGILSWQARIDALELGLGEEQVWTAA